MTPTGITSIIRACAEAKVTEFIWGDLIVRFSDNKWYENLTIGDTAPNNDGRTTENPPDSGLTEEFRKDHLLLTDPVAYEEELLNN
jgi:hypothetical protein